MWKKSGMQKVMLEEGDILAGRRGAREGGKEGETVGGREGTKEGRREGGQT